MKTDAQNLLLMIGGAGFLVYLVLKLWEGSGERGTEHGLAKRRMLEAKRRGNDRSAPNSQRAAAFRDAASEALEGLGRIGLAAAFARRAARLEPGNSDAVSLLALALRRSARYSALEQFLWQRLSDLDVADAAAFDRAFEELVALYAGPLRRPETARVLRRLYSPLTAATDAATDACRAP
ncbi:MAG TPA: hypothetical protein VGI70_11050 [Polyangiales bacterium]|jgi:hypothetical protein